MAKRNRPLAPAPRVSRLAACLWAGALLPTSVTLAGACGPCPSGTPVAACSPAPNPHTAAADFLTQPDAAAADTWLTHAIPVGTTLADAPDFFAAASEVFYDADEDLMVFVYRSAERGRWLAWVSFDARRMSVVNTSAVEL